MVQHDCSLHAGELELQRRFDVPSSVQDMARAFIRPEMPVQHSTFFSDLLYFAISTTDSVGRPWATLLVGGTSSSSEIATPVVAKSSTTLLVKTIMSRDDPFGKCIADRANGGAQLWAGLGIDFTNRRRNKVGGRILSACLTFRNAHDSVALLEMTLETNESLGNCPKYITERLLVPLERTPVLVDADDRELTRMAGEAANSPSGLSQEAIRLIHQSSTVYIATRHLTGRESDSDMGLNARGGNPGFVRVDVDPATGVGTHLVVPDFSGNRVYQSLGNVVTDPFAGLMVPCFKTGDALYVTGNAKLLFDGDARAVMPRVSFLLVIEVTAHVLIKGALNMELVDEERLSPYNPPVRYLASELAAMGRLPQGSSDFAAATGIVASLVDVECRTSEIASFTFELSSMVSFLPGSFAVFDFSEQFDSSYQHMNNADPKSLNDDHVRTWTISSSPSSSRVGGAGAGGDHARAFKSTDRITCTIKRVKGGDVSSFLHELARPGGVGITPFMAFAAGIQAHRENLLLHPHQDTSRVDVAVLFGGRGDETSMVMAEFGGHSFVSSVAVFDSMPEASARDKHGEREQRVVSPQKRSVQYRRMQKSDIASVLELRSRVAYICGPSAFMAAVRAWLEELGVPGEQIHSESFAF